MANNQSQDIGTTLYNANGQVGQGISDILGQLLMAIPRATAQVSGAAGALSNVGNPAMSYGDIGSAVKKAFSSGYQNPLANAHQDVTTQVYKKAIKDKATQMQQAGVDPATAMSHALEADKSLGLHQPEPTGEAGATEETPQAAAPPQNINPKTPFDGPLGILKAIMPYPFAMPDLMKQGWQQNYASTPQGMVDIRKAENALPLSTEQQSGREVQIYSAKREIANNQLQDLHNQMTDLNSQEAAAHAEATAAMGTSGMLGKTTGRQDILDNLNTKLFNIQTDRGKIARKMNNVSLQLKNLLSNAPQVTPSSEKSSGGYQKTPSGLEYRIKK